MSLPEYKREKTLTKVRIEKGLCVALILTICVFVLSKREYTPRNRSNPTLQLMIDVVELPPRTLVSNPDPSPILPKVPFPVEDEYVAPYETIDLVEFDLFVDVNPPEYTDEIVNNDNTRFLTGKTKPEKIKGYVKLALLVNQQGWVDSVVVISNTTNSYDFELKSVKKAYRSRYLTEKARKNVYHWIERKFEKKDIL